MSSSKFRAKALFPLLALLAAVMLVSACGDYTIADFADTITLTNSSTSHSALVLLSTSQMQTQVVLATGKSQTFQSIAATKYSVQVASAGVETAANYVARLHDLRDELVGLLVSPGDSGATPEAVLIEIVRVQTALQQINPLGFQACTHAIVTGASNTATMTWASSGDQAGFWDLSCD